MLAIAGAVSWVGYLFFVFGLSQLAGQNYSIGDLAIPGKFTLGNPAPDPPGTPAPGTHTTTPCTAAQLAAGWVNAQGGCTAGSPTTGNGSTGSGRYACFDNATGANTGYLKPYPGATLTKCPKGSSKRPLQA